MKIEKLKIPYPVIVEGKYDRLRVLDVAECQVLCTDGFGIFRKQERLAIFRELAKKSPIILLTDSDGAGKLIRSHLTGAVPKDRLIQLYIPQIKGKEKRKQTASAEGYLGVEGMEQELLYQLLSPYANEKQYASSLSHPLSKVDFYEDGLTGKQDSSARRNELAGKLGLPAGMTSNALLAALRVLLTYEEYLILVGRKKN